jgi:hypothetical protein
MKVLDAGLGFQNRWARRLGRYYGRSIPSALILGLEPVNPAGCSECSSRSNCPREGIHYRDLVRTVEEGRKLGIRLYLSAGGAKRYWPELLDLALRNPDCIFLLFTGAGFGDDAPGAGTITAGKTRAGKTRAETTAGGAAALQKVAARTAETTALEVTALEAAAAGNLGFALPHFGDGRPTRTAGLGKAASVLREAGVPFGFLAGVPADRIEEICADSWLEGMLEQGCLFGFFYPAGESTQTMAGADVDDSPDVGAGVDVGVDVNADGKQTAPRREIGRLKQVSPIRIVDLEEDVVFTGELGRDDPPGVERSGRRSPLLVHPVTSRIRSLTLLESMEALSVCPLQAVRDEVEAACPLLLDRGNTRQVLYALLSAAADAGLGRRSQSRRRTADPGSARGN